MKSNKILMALVCIVLALTLLLNVQFYMFTKGFNQNSIVPANAGALGALETEDAFEDVSVCANARLKPLRQQLDGRIRLDDFLEPVLWSGTRNEAELPGQITITSRGQEANMLRKFDGFLPLQTYIFLDLKASGVENIEWITLYLLEDTSYANYFECSLRPFLSEDKADVILNKSDFQIGSGVPDWEKISTLKIAFDTAKGSETTLTVGEISTYGASPLCSIWFDDGWNSTYSQAYPIMKEKGQKGILSVISSHVNYGHFCSETQLHEMYDYGWDMVNHTLGHKNLSELGLSEAELEITACKQYLESQGFTRSSDHFVPPYCATSEELSELIGKYSLTSRPNWLTFNYLPIIDPYQLGFMEVTHETSPDTVKKWIDEAIENDLWLVLMFHSIENPADVSTKYSIEGFKEIVDYLDLKKTQIKCATISEIMEADIIIRPNEAVPDKPGEWSLAWEDQFDGAAPDQGIWNIVSAQPFANNELQTYAPENVGTADGNLVITSTKGDTYFSGAVTTDNKKLMQYGKLEIRAKLPSGKGIFPAFWLKPASGGILPEIDIIEFLGHEPDTVWHVFHYNDEKGAKQSASHKFKGGDLTKDYHVFGLEWTEQSIKWFVDGVETFSVENNSPSNKLYLYINTAIGGNWPSNPDSSTEFPQAMYIDYVKYYTRSNAK